MRDIRTTLVRIFTVVPVVVAAGVGPVVSAPAQAGGLRPYQAVDLGFAGRSTAINDNRQVVGEIIVGTGFDIYRHPFLWERGRYIDLGVLAAGSFEHGVANDINNRGQVVGQSAVLPGTQHAFLWADGVMTDLGTLGGEWSAATRINDRGQVIGFSQTATGEWHSFLWQNGVMTDLGDYGISDINNRGQLVGRGRFLVGMTEAAINDAGVVVGYLSHDETETNEAYLWRAGTTVNIGVSGRSTSALDINNRGEVIMQTIGDWLLWRNGVHVSLSRLGVRTTGHDVSRLNNHGDVVAGGYDSDIGMRAMVYLRR